MTKNPNLCSTTVRTEFKYANVLVFSDFVGISFAQVEDHIWV